MKKEDWKEVGKRSGRRKMGSGKDVEGGKDWGEKEVEGKMAS